MELFLLEDINGVGKKNDIVIVGDGFALNHLLPTRRALVATPTVRKRYADAIKRRAMERENEKKLHLEAAAMLAGKSVSFSRKVAKTGKLYAAISEQDIASALKDQHSIDIPASKISIADPIKGIGTFQVQVRLKETPLQLAVSVAREETPAKKKTA